MLGANTPGSEKLLLSVQRWHLPILRATLIFLFFIELLTVFLQQPHWSYKSGLSIVAICLLVGALINIHSRKKTFWILALSALTLWRLLHFVHHYRLLVIEVYFGFAILFLLYLLALPKKIAMAASAITAVFILICFYLNNFSPYRWQKALVMSELNFAAQFLFIAIIASVVILSFSVNKKLLHQSKETWQLLCGSNKSKTINYEQNHSLHKCLQQLWADEENGLTLASAKRQRLWYDALNYAQQQEYQLENDIYVPAKKLINELYNGTQGLANSKSIKQCLQESGLSDEGLLPSRLISEIILNYWSNAVEQCSEKQGKIDWQIVRNNKGLFIRIINNGKKFWWSGSATVPKPGEAHGWGLWTVMRRAYLIKSKVYCRPNKQGGTTCTLWIPEESLQKMI